MSSFFREAATSYTPTDNSDALRQESSSSRLIPEIHGLYAIDAVYPGLRESDPDRFKELVKTKCPFFFHNYEGVLNCWMKSPKEKQIFLNMIQALRKIELGEMSQHEASQVVGASLQPFIPSTPNIDLNTPGLVKPKVSMTFQEWKKTKSKS
jgi:hypothetical protein